MQSTTLEAACLGKLPTHGDFVRHRASTPTMRTFDEWVRTGLHRVRQRHDRAWDEAYDEAPPIRFFFSGRGRKAPNVLVGVLHPSRDRKGRTYPFSVTCELPRSSFHAGHVASLPLQSAHFFTTADQIAQEAIAGSLSYREVSDRVASMDPRFSLDSSAPAEYTRFTRQETLGAFLELLFDRDDAPRKYGLFKNLFDVFLPQRRRSTPRLNYGLQFPLGADEDALTTTACFWLDLSLRLLDHPDTTLSFFWTPQVPKTSSPFLLLFVGPPRASAVFHRLTSDEASEDLFEIAPSGSVTETEAARSVPDEYEAHLEDEQQSLQDVLQYL